MNTLTALCCLPELVLAAVLLAVVDRYLERWAYRLCLVLMVTTFFALGWIVVAQ